MMLPAIVTTGTYNFDGYRYYTMPADKHMFCKDDIFPLLMRWVE